MRMADSMLILNRDFWVFTGCDPTPKTLMSCKAIIELDISINPNLSLRAKRGNPEWRSSDNRWIASAVARLRNDA